MVDQKLAREIAVDAKSDLQFTPDDIGIYADVPETCGMSPVEFEELCIEVERLITEVEIDPVIRAAWCRASADLRAEERAERTYFAGDR